MTPDWRRHLIALACVWGAIGLLFARDLGHMVVIWWTSSTFAHCLLIPPIIAWLVWQRWPELRAIVPRGWLPGLVIVVVGGVGWLIGDVAGVGLARHFGLVIMLQGAVIVVMGPEVVRGVLFPLFYMLFMVPAGEELVPSLQTITARMSMALLGLAGVPAHIEGIFITIPNGWFKVAEACSGVKFLVAMLAYSVLVANVCFRSWPRRVAFVTAALALSVLANGVRAWGTIYVAHLSDVSVAQGVDHVFYGWIFFGLIITILMGVGWRYFDRPANTPWLTRPIVSADSSVAVPVAAGSVLALALATWGWALYADREPKPVSRHVALPEVPGWRAVRADGDAVPWQPHFAGADRLMLRRYADARGRKVDLAVAIYANQVEGRELVGFGQGAIGPDSPWSWTNDDPAPADGRAFRITGPGDVERDVVVFYRVGDIMTGNEFRVKVETLKAKLTGGPRRGVALIVTAPGERGRAAIDAFLGRLGPLDTLADRLAGKEP